jgi:SnoaL-like domain
MPVPRASVEAIGRQFVDAFNRRVVEDMVALCHPEVEFHPTALVGERRRYDGHEGLRRWFSELVPLPPTFAPAPARIGVM